MASIDQNKAVLLVTENDTRGDEAGKAGNAEGSDIL